MHGLYRIKITTYTQYIEYVTLLGIVDDHMHRTMLFLEICFKYASGLSNKKNYNLQEYTDDGSVH